MVKKSIKKSLLSLFLVFTLMFGLIFGSVGSVDAATSNVRSPGSTGRSKVSTSVAPAIFSVTVPYVLPISIDKVQNVYTADNAKIANNSNGPIRVKSAEITTINDWEIVDNSTDFNSVPVNSKQFSLKLMNSSINQEGSIDPDIFTSIDGNNSLNITYDAEAAVQSEAVNATNIANTVFTIEWDKIEVTTATIDKAKLQSFVNSKKSFQKTPESLNIDDVKALDGVVRLDDGTTDKVIYGWSDGEDNCYWWTNALIAYLPEDSSQLFYKNSLTSLDLSSLDTSNVTNLSSMFSGCTSLTSLNLSSLDTSKVTNMSGMFRTCDSIISLDLSPLNTSKVTDMSHMFEDCSSLTSLDLSNFDTSKVTNMSCMFAGSCNNVSDHISKLVSINLSSFDTSNVTNMSYMFYWCDNLTSLDLSSFDTSKVTNMSYMFNYSRNLQKIYVSDFDTSKVTNSNNMFLYCSELVGENGTKYNSSYTNKIYACIDTEKTPGYFTKKSFDDFAIADKAKLRTLIRNLTTFQKTKEKLSLGDVLSFENVTRLDNGATDKVVYGWYDSEGNGYWWSNAEITYLPENSANLFVNFTNLISLDLSSFDTSNVINMNNMFGDCSNLTSLDLSNFDTSKVTDMSYMFYKCPKLSSLDLSSFNTSKVTNMSYMFNRCSNLTTIYVSDFNTSGVSSSTSTYMFTGCTKLVGGNGTKYSSSYVNKTYARIDKSNSKGYFTASFPHATISKTLMSNFASNLTTFQKTKENLTLDEVLTFDNVTKLDDGKTDKVVYGWYDEEGNGYWWSNAKTTYLPEGSYYLFSDCSKLTSLDLSNFDTSKVTNIESMFSYCSNLTSLDLSNFDTSNVTNMTRIFQGCSKLASLDSSSFDTSKVTNMSYMFEGCSKLTSLDLSNFNTSNTTNMYDMFYGCSNLSVIYVSDFNTNKVTNSNYMFTGCSKLIGGNGTGYNSSYVDKTYARIDTEETPGYFTQKKDSVVTVIQSSIASLMSNIFKFF